METIIECRNISKRYLGQKFPALKRVSLDIKKGEFLSLVGPSGCGKSTLVRIMTGLNKPSSGQVLYKGEVQKGINSEISMVFQTFALLPWLTVKENVEFGLKMQGKLHWLEKHQVQGYLSMVGLSDVFNQYPRELSGGMKQRVGIARALVVDPEVLILDEPFSELDVITATELRSDLLKIWQETGKTIIMISHLVEEAVEMADRVAIMSMGEIKKIFPIDLPRPRQLEGQEFISLVGQIKEILGLRHD